MYPPLKRFFREFKHRSRSIYRSLKNKLWNEVTAKEVKLFAKIGAVVVVVSFFWYLMSLQYVKAVLCIILGLSAVVIVMAELDNLTARIFAFIFAVALLILLLDVFNINLFPLLQSLVEA